MLTPQQRIEAYDLAIYDVKKYPGAPYMCPVLDGYSFSNGSEGYRVPEFELFRPKNKFCWLRPTEEGNKTREIILLFCIEMAKDELTPQGDK